MNAKKRHPLGAENPSPRTAKKLTWPPIKPSVKNDRPGWLVDCRIGGKGQRFFVGTKAEAKTVAEAARIRRINEGKSALANEKLAAYGWTVAKAIDFALDYLRRRQKSVPLQEAVAAYLEFKKHRVGPRRMLDMTQRLGRIVAALKGETPLASIDSDALNALLDTVPHPATRNDYRKEIVALWRFANAKPREWTDVKLDNLVLPRAKEGAKARIILTVDQCRRLMAASEDEDVRALNALILFGGLRREEVERLDWSAVDFRAGHVNVTVEVSKVNAERFSPMSDNLRAWLKPISKKAGPIVSRNIMHPLRRTWRTAGIVPWPQDAHRHSFISYRRQLVGDARTALEAGTSETIIKRHYKRPVLQEDAKAFFAIMPEEPANVTAFKAA